MSIIVFDYDWVIFKAACAVEKRFITVKNKKTNEDFKFNNRTELYGNWRKKDGGWLALQEGITLDDLEIEDDREVEPLANALQLAKTIIENTVNDLNGFEYWGYVSGSSNFRKDICTLLPYKGNRDNLIVPVHRKDVSEYLVKHHNAIRTDKIEADDAVVMQAYKSIKDKQSIVCAVNEKDFLGCDGNWWNYDNKTLTKVRGFGELHRNSKGEVKGTGRMWKYFQVCFSDRVDNYAANCFSPKNNGEVAVYNRLKDCKNDLEAFSAMKEHFMHLYPEPIEITNFRGSTFIIDWIYVMQEQFNMAHLHRFKDDFINVREVMKNLGVL